METSILKSTKKILGLAEDYTVFDQDVITHINATFFTLLQLGIGPVNGFMIEDDGEEWDDFTTDEPIQNAVKTYVYLKVRMLFDPPTTSYVLDAFQKQIEQAEWRLNIERESTEWVDPIPVVIDDE